MGWRAPAAAALRLSRRWSVRRENHERLSARLSVDPLIAAVRGLHFFATVDTVAALAGHNVNGGATHALYLAAAISSLDGDLPCSRSRAIAHLAASHVSSSE